MERDIRMYSEWLGCEIVELNMISHEEVLEAAKAAEPKFAAIFKRLIEAI